MLGRQRLIPIRTHYALQKTLSTSFWAASWQRLHRQIFWLSDGQRDVQRMATLLHKPGPRIEEAIEELIVGGLVSIQVERKILLMDVALLKKSFEMVMAQKDEFAHSFYQRLFSDYPATKALFAKTDMKRQEGSLMATLATVVAGVERGDNLTPTLQALGEKHRTYGARPEHYPLVGAVLLETFHEYLGSKFTVQMQEAWSQAFEIISGQMIAGASR